MGAHDVVGRELGAGQVAAQARVEVVQRVTDALGQGGGARGRNEQELIGVVDGEAGAGGCASSRTVHGWTPATETSVPVEMTGTPGRSSGEIRRHRLDADLVQHQAGDLEAVAPGDHPGRGVVAVDVGGDGPETPERERQVHELRGVRDVDADTIALANAELPQAGGDAIDRGGGLGVGIGPGLGHERDALAEVLAVKELGNPTVPSLETAS